MPDRRENRLGQTHEKYSSCRTEPGGSYCGLLISWLLQRVNFALCQGRAINDSRLALSFEDSKPSFMDGQRSKPSHFPIAPSRKEKTSAPQTFPPRLQNSPWPSSWVSP